MKLREWRPGDTRLDGTKWRVKRHVVPIPKPDPYEHVRPWQIVPLPAPPQPTTTFAVWGIWPPGWSLAQAPLLVFPNWPMAFRAAADRAEFANSPTTSQDVSNVLHAPLFEGEEMTDG